MTIKESNKQLKNVYYYERQFKMIKHLNEFDIPVNFL